MASITAKRGRPSAAKIPELIRAGELTDSNIKCDFCHRDFPRPKSLNTHRKIHTNEKPYVCTFPECSKEFRQSGQLKNHVRRHTNEKPFACPEPGCSQRFIHSSRRCSKHPHHDLIKDGQEQICIGENRPEAVLRWFEEYIQNKGKPTKRTAPSTPDSVKRLKSDDATSSSVTSDDSCSGTPIDCFSPQEIFGDKFYNNSDQNCSQSTNPEDIEAAAILCSFSQRAR